jgi:DNA-binding response OmpR family regulator
MRILVADDDLTLSRLLEHRLRERGYEVLVTQDVVLTWQVIQRQSPHLVILDIKMPGGSGLAVLRRMKQNLNTVAVPVIVITAADDPGTLQQIMGLHPDALMRKPIQLADLDFEVTRLLAARDVVKTGEVPDPKGRR